MWENCGADSLVIVECLLSFAIVKSLLESSFERYPLLILLQQPKNADGSHRALKTICDWAIEGAFGCS